MTPETAVKTKRKRGDLNIASWRARPGRKKIRVDLKTMVQKIGGVDRISQLPDHIIHQIIGHLRCKKDAVRTSILSKRWRDIWASISHLVFDQHKFNAQLMDPDMSSDRQMQENKNAELFKNYVYSILQRRVKQKDSIEKFVLRMAYYTPKLNEDMDYWIDLAIRNNITELDLQVPGFMHRRYSLPQCVFAADRITALRVYGCMLEPGNGLNFSNLQKLSLGKHYVKEEIIEKVIQSCPLLEDFRLICTIGLKTFKVSNLSKLKRVDLHLCRGLKKVDLQAANLETFWYCANKSKHGKIDLSTCNALKFLTLEDAKLKDELFQNLLSCFPVLEKLVLSKCTALKNITISSYRLRTLILRGCEQLEEADIDTPNLASFEYKGDKMPFSSLNPSSLKEAKLHFKLSKPEAKARFCSGDDNASWFARLQEFLEKFDYSKGLKLVARSDKDIAIFEKPKEIFLPRVYDLKLDVVKPSTALEDLLEDILRTWHPLTLSSISVSKSNLPKLVHKKLIARPKEPSCCTYNVPSNKCWRHFLVTVKNENLVNSKSTSEWIAWLRSSSATFKTNCFRLCWKH